MLVFIKTLQKSFFSTLNEAQYTSFCLSRVAH